MFLSAYQTQVLARVMAALAEPHGEQDLRMEVGALMLELLGAQHYASYVWNDDASAFVHGVHVNMDPGNLDRYEAYYQFHDPITFELQRHRRAVRVNDVLSQPELKRTEFFNDFLARDGLYWGINLYAWDGDRNIGDMRIWRDRRRENFTRDDRALLDLMRPAFVAALRRCRDNTREQPIVLPSHQAFGVQPAWLSTRELAVARLVARGLADKVIAQNLGISVTTVRTHLDHAFRKLGVENRTALAAKLSYQTRGCDGPAATLKEVRTD
jgi:DNA-binding CsgD family transcriptional regulator